MLSPLSSILDPLSSSRRRPRGFALLVAIALIAVVGMALLALSSAFATEAHRTQAASADTQLRQLLLAAPAYAPAYLESWNKTTEQLIDIPLPANLSADHARLTLLLTPPSSPSAPIAIEVHASLPHRHARQALTYARSQSTFTLTDVAFEP